MASTAASPPLAGGKGKENRPCSDQETSETSQEISEKAVMDDSAPSPERKRRAKTKKNLFALTDAIAKKLREVLFNTRKAVSVIGKIYTMEKEHNEAKLVKINEMLQGSKKGRRSSASSKDGRQSGAGDIVNAKEEKGATVSDGKRRDRRSNSAAGSSKPGGDRKLGPMQAWQSTWEVLQSEAEERQLSAKLVLRKVVVPLRKLTSAAIALYNTIVGRHSECAKELKTRRGRMEKLRASTMRLIKQCDQEMKASLKDTSSPQQHQQPKHESLIGKLAGMVLGNADLKALRQEVLTTYQSYLLSLKDLNKFAEFAIKRQLPALCKEYQKIGVDMGKTLSAHLNVLAALTARSSAIAASSSKELERTLSKASEELAEFMEERLNADEGPEGYRSVSFENLLPISIQDVSNNVFHRAKKKIKPLDMACEILDASSILTKEQLKTVIRSVPSRYHMRDWACTYAMKKDGASLERMSRSLKNSRGKIIIFKDSTGGKFGFFTHDAFVRSATYYGGRETQIFKIEENYDLEKKTERKKQATSSATTVSSSEKGSIAAAAAAGGGGGGGGGESITRTRRRRKKSVKREEEAVEAIGSSKGGARTNPSIFKVPAQKKGGTKERSRVLVWKWTGENDCMLLLRESSLTVGGSDPAIYVDRYLKNGTSGASSTFGSPALSTTAEDEEFVLHDVEAWGEVE